jgi:hypothetical protein
MHSLSAGWDEVTCQQLKDMLESCSQPDQAMHLLLRNSRSHPATLAAEAIAAAAAAARAEQTQTQAQRSKQAKRHEGQAAAPAGRASESEADEDDRYVCSSQCAVVAGACPKFAALMSPCPHMP